jgi:hypothetical protein
MILIFNSNFSFQFILYILHLNLHLVTIFLVPIHLFQAFMVTPNICHLSAQRGLSVVFNVAAVWPGGESENWLSL